MPVQRHAIQSKGLQSLPLPEHNVARLQMFSMLPCQKYLLMLSCSLLASPYCMVRLSHACHNHFSRMRSEGFPFIVWGSGGWTRVRFVCCVPAWSSRVVAGVVAGASLIPCRGDLRLGRVACVACVALCHGDCCWAGRVGAAVPWGLASRACRVCGVTGAVVWGLLLGVGIAGAVPWGLLLGRSCGRRCAVGIGVSGVSRVWRDWRCALGIAAGRGDC